MNKDTIERATTEPPRWPWVIAGLGFFPVLALVIEFMGRVANSLSWRVGIFANHPGLAGAVVWGLAAVGIAVAVVVWHAIWPGPKRAIRTTIGTTDPATAPPSASGDDLAADEESATAGRSRRGAMVEGLIYGLATFLILLPATADPLNRIAGTGDAWNMVWIHWRLAEMFKSGNLLPWHIPDAVFPFGLDLRVSDGNLPVLIGTAWALVAPPVLAFNLSVATGVMLNILSARRLARVFIIDRIPVIIIALAFATAPAIALRTFGHYTLLFAFAGPLLVAEGIEIIRGDRQPKPLRIGLLLFAAYLSSIYMLLAAGLALAIIILLDRQDRAERVRRLAALALGGAITVALMSPFVYARIQLDRAEVAAGGGQILTGEAFYYSGDAYSVFAQPVSSTFEAPWNDQLRDAFIPNTLEATVFPGFILLIALGALLFTRSRLRIPLVAAATGLWLLTLGPGFSADGRVPFSGVGWLPFQLLQSVPTFGSLRTPNRFSFVLAAVLTAALAFMVSVWWARWDNRKRAAASVVGFLLLAANLQLPINNAKQPTADDEVAVLAAVAAMAKPGDTVMIVPGDCSGRVGITSNWQIEHGLPFVGCQGNTASLPLYSQMDSYMTQAISAFRCQPEAFARRVGLPNFQLLQVLPDHVAEVSATFGVRFLLIDKVMVAGDATCLERGKAASIESLANWYEAVGETEQLLALDVTRGPLAGDAGLEAVAGALYEIMLGRTPTAEEAAAAVSTIETIGRDGLRDSIRASEEFASANCDEREATELAAPAFNDATFVELVYDTMLLRGPDRQGFTNSVAYLGAPEGDRAALVRSLTQSPEFMLGACGPA